MVRPLLADACVCVDSGVTSTGRSHSEGVSLVRWTQSQGQRGWPLRVTRALWLQWTTAGIFVVFTVLRYPRPFSCFVLGQYMNYALAGPTSTPGRRMDFRRRLTVHWGSRTTFPRRRTSPRFLDGLLLSKRNVDHDVCTGIVAPRRTSHWSQRLTKRDQLLVTDIQTGEDRDALGCDYPKVVSLFTDACSAHEKAIGP